MWNLEPNERLREWKKFREHISNIDVQLALEETNSLWSYAPYVNRYLDKFDTKDWPDPWSLLYENKYCDLAKSLGMLYTLYLSGHYGNTLEDIEIKIYKNTQDNDILHVVWIDDGKYMLNFAFNSVVNKDLLNENYIQLCSHSTQSLKHKF